MTEHGGCGTVLLIEDDQDIRESVVDALEGHGYHVVCAVHGQHALEKLRARDAVRPSLILLDMMMPVMDGWQFRAVQLADEALKRIPVLALTAHADAERIAREAQIGGVLRKPLELQSLLAAVARFKRSEFEPLVPPPDGVPACEPGQLRGV